MPTVTTPFGYAVTNLGPLTNAYTAPASCATNTELVQIAVPTDPSIVQWEAGCDISRSTLGACYPSGTVVDAEVNKPGRASQANENLIMYFSPGIACPAGWQTAGVAAKAADGSLSTTGVFHPSVALPSRIRAPIFNPRLNVLMGAIDPGETAVLCCPSSMTSDIQGFCYSTLPDYKITTGCARIIPDEDLGTITGTSLSIYGTTISVDLLTFTATSPITETRTTDFRDPTGSSDESWIGISLLPMVTLVHKASDAGGTSGAGGGSGGTGSGSSTTTSSNAAVAIGLARMPGGGGGGGIGAVVVFCLVAMAVGSALVLPL